MEFSRAAEGQLATAPQQQQPQSTQHQQQQPQPPAQIQVQTSNQTITQAQPQTQSQPPAQPLSQVKASAVTTQPQQQSLQPPTIQQPQVTVQPQLTIQPQQTMQKPQAIQLTTNNSQPLPLSIKPPTTVTTPPTFVPHITATTTPNPIAAHQQSITLVQQPALVNRPPTTLTIVPLTTTATTIKSEPNKYICCLLDNGVRCDRIAGNASFSARIQKIVGTKKMNFALDPNVRHAYICDHHKAIITVAKKSTTLSRDLKSNARNYNTSNNTNVLASAQHNSNYNDISLRQPTLQHQVNLELLTNQNRIVNNHAVVNNIPIRPGAQIAYGHYPGAHPNQVAPMDVMMSAGFDNTGGDSRPSSSGGVDVDLQQLQVNTLRRYKRHFRVQTRPGLNKTQLAESLKSHFRTLPIIEKEAITYFVYIVKCYRNKLDHNPKAD